MSTPVVPKPVVLCILDGWGAGKSSENNAILQAKTPNWDSLVANCPNGLLEASEENVGLPNGQVGNSEVGHMNIGAGRIVPQDLMRITKQCEGNRLKKNKKITSFCSKLKKIRGSCHIMGLLSDGGVHSHQNQIFSLIKAVSSFGIPVVFHCFSDGRDVSPLSSQDFISTLNKTTKGIKDFKIGTISGRYYAMDRDRRWDRIEKSYMAIVEGKGRKSSTAFDVISNSYKIMVTDEFIAPTVIGDYEGMKDGDGVLMANFRADRVREILTSLVDKDFSGFKRTKVIKYSSIMGLTKYSFKLNSLMDTLFSNESIHNSIGEIISKNGFQQLRIAETEKYAHVTFFLNGGEEGQFEGEYRTLIPSPRVATYDLKPEMSAYEVTKVLSEAIESGKYQFIVVNYANPDMVGHTGVMSAAIKAVEVIDECVGKITNSIERMKGAIFFTADHGNIEVMRDEKTGIAHTAHTHNPVPTVLFGAPKDIKKLRNGSLADISPTLLDLMGVNKPNEMSGQSLLIRN